MRDKTLAGWLAENRVNELRLQEQLPDISDNSEDTDYGNYRWRVTTVVLGTAEPTMRRVEVTGPVPGWPERAVFGAHSLPFWGRNDAA